ncbi:heat shock protein 30-like [Centruroides sculpturatus]|uniref:heat shock protein 30-like n=1 Tax=Centruroides sculpturatus TaxID=218467 RepID=UPI000C6DE4E4|nr:heat shock protein 30-like [Centruroides sculpturatus]
MALLSLWEDLNENRRHNCTRRRRYPFSDLLADLQDELVSELRSLPSFFSDESVSRKRLRRVNDKDEGLFIELEETKHYAPDELKVKVKGRQVDVTGKHEEKDADGSNYVFREFRRTFQLPRDADPETVTSELSRDGLLRIRASPLDKEKSIQIVVEREETGEKITCDEKDGNTQELM